MKDITPDRLITAIKRLNDMLIKHPEAPKEFTEDILIVISHAVRKWAYEEDEVEDGDA